MALALKTQDEGVNKAIAASAHGPPEIVALQPVAMVDHVCTVEEATLKSLLADEEQEGSKRVGLDQIQSMLASIGEFHSKAGGSAANTMRGLAGFGVRSGLVGARGQDEFGALFVSSMKRANVDITRFRSLDTGTTGRCVILTCNGHRTMRTSLTNAARLAADALSEADFSGAKWVFTSGYSFYGRDLLPTASRLARAVGAQVALDLASFEVVRAFRPQLLQLLEAKEVDCVFCNEDEAVELTGGPDAGGSARKGLELLAQYCDLAIVTLGERGCLVQQRGEEVVEEPAVPGVKVVDSTGAGDLFASGFLYGLLRGYPTRRCAQIGCLAGGAVTQAVGGELSQENWRWLFARLHGELAALVVRESATAVQGELLACYALIERLGRGVVYYGSARLKEDSPHWGRAQALGRRLSQMLHVTTWSGGGPGMMEAATLGALEAGGAVGGIRISREAGTTVRTAKTYLPANAAVFCKFLSSRKGEKVALVDAGVRTRVEDRSAYIFLPGGLGTMDELFEITTLMQLGKLGSKFPVPLILANYDGFYSSLLAFLAACDANGTVGAIELKDVLLAATNDDVVAALAAFYGLPGEGGESGVAAASQEQLAAMRASSQIPALERSSS